jgi:hypothetical protein
LSARLSCAFAPLLIRCTGKTESTYFYSIQTISFNQICCQLYAIYYSPKFSTTSPKHFIKLLVGTLSFTLETIVEKGFTGIYACATLPLDLGRRVSVRCLDRLLDCGKKRASSEFSTTTSVNHTFPKLEILIVSEPATSLWFVASNRLDQIG